MEGCLRDGIFGMDAKFLVEQNSMQVLCILLPGESKTQVIVWFTGIEDSMPDALVVFCFLLNLVITI